MTFKNMHFSTSVLTTQRAHAVGADRTVATHASGVAAATDGHISPLIAPQAVM